MSAKDKDRQKHNLKYTANTPRYLFGADLSGSLKREDFVKLQSDLISDVLEMEFTRYFKFLSCYSDISALLPSKLKLPRFSGTLRTPSTTSPRRTSADTCSTPPPSRRRRRRR